MSIDSLIDGVIGREGGYSNNPNDSGGETMWGVTIARGSRKWLRWPDEGHAARGREEHLFQLSMCRSPASLRSCRCRTRLLRSWSTLA
jgi:hypothetical protein